MLTLRFQGVGLSSLDTRGYNRIIGNSQGPQICRSSGYWTIESWLLAIDCSMLRGASMLRKPLMNERVLFLRIEAGFFIYAREKHARGNQLVCSMVCIAEMES